MDFLAPRTPSSLDYKLIKKLVKVSSHWDLIAPKVE